MQRFFPASCRQGHVHPINVCYVECYEFLLAVLQKQLASNEQTTVFSTSVYSNDEDYNETHSHVNLFRI